MASASGNSTSRSRTNTRKNTKSSAAKSTSKGAKRSTSNSRGRKPSKASRQNVDIAVKSEVMLIVIFAAAIFMFLCIIGVIHGAAATGISNVMFGVFGLLAYLIPVIIFVGFAFGISNKGNTVAIVKMVSGVILIFLLGILSYMLLKQDAMLTGNALVRELYDTSVEHHAGGGVLFGSIAHGMYQLIGFGGTLFVAVVLGIISVVFITEKSFLSGVKRGSAYLYESAREDAARMREYRESLREEYDDYEEYDDPDEYEETEEPVYEEKVRPRRPKRVKSEKNHREQRSELPRENIKRMDKRARGVVSSAAITFKTEKLQDIHEIMLLDDEAGADAFEEIKVRPYNETAYPEPESAGEPYFEEIYSDGQYDGTASGEDAYQEENYAQPAYIEATQETFVNTDPSYDQRMQDEMASDDLM